MILTDTPGLARITLAATLAAWLRSWGAGRAGLGDVVHHVGETVSELAEHDHMVLNHTMRSDAQEPSEDPRETEYAEPLEFALRSFDGMAAGDIRLLLPAPGDTRGLPHFTSASSPTVKAFVTAAVEAGCVVLHTSPADGTLTGLVVAPMPGRMVAWHRYTAPQQQPRSVPTPVPHWAPKPEALSPADADATLIAALHDATAALDRLELAAARPDAAQQLSLLRRELAHGPQLPPSYSSRQRLRLARAGLVLGIAELAAADTDAGAVDSHQIVGRAAALRKITAAARSAYAATVNAPFEEASQTTAATQQSANAGGLE